MSSPCFWRTLSSSSRLCRARTSLQYLQTHYTQSVCYHSTLQNTLVTSLPARTSLQYLQTHYTDSMLSFYTTKYPHYVSTSKNQLAVPTNTLHTVSMLPFYATKYPHYVSTSKNQLAVPTNTLHSQYVTILHYKIQKFVYQTYFSFILTEISKHLQ